MTSVQNRARLLIISNSIYARRSDGSLCPGTIQTRHSDVYIVKFDDGAVERVLEDKLTWVGFGGMPPQIWPKTPVIHPTSSWETFRDRTMPHRDSDRRLKEQKFGSFNEQRVYESMSSELPSETHNTHFQSSKADTNIPSHLLPKQIDSNQPRSSVLRISSNVLSKEGNLSDFLNFSDPVQDELISVDKSLHNPSHDEKHSKDNRSDFETQFASLATEKSRQTTDTHEAFQGHLDYDWPLQQVMCKYSLDRGGSSSALDVGASYASQEEEEEEMRMADAELEYYKKKFRRFSALDCSPSVNPSHFISSPLPFFSPPFEIDFLNVSAPAMPSSFRLHTKTKKKIEKKKCRKVYGIENRQFWCRQCRWKKACTRFKTANKITTNGFA